MSTAAEAFFLASRMAEARVLAERDFRSYQECRALERKVEDIKASVEEYGHAQLTFFGDKHSEAEEELLFETLKLLGFLVSGRECFEETRWRDNGFGYRNYNTVVVSQKSK